MDKIELAITELEFLFATDRYPSLKEHWEVVREAALSTSKRRVVDEEKLVQFWEDMSLAYANPVNTLADYES